MTLSSLCASSSQTEQAEAKQRERTGFGHQSGHDGEIEVSPCSLAVFGRSYGDNAIMEIETEEAVVKAKTERPRDGAVVEENSRGADPLPM